MMLGCLMVRHALLRNAPHHEEEVSRLFEMMSAQNIPPHPEERRSRVSKDGSGTGLPIPDLPGDRHY
jgi:hypothetical protein